VEDSLNPVAIRALRVVIVVMLLGLVLTQALLLPIVADDLAHTYPAVSYLQAPVLTLAILGIAAVQTAILCVWRLLTMVDRATVFSADAFRYVDTIIGAAAVAAVVAAGAVALLVAAPVGQFTVTMGVAATAVGATGVGLLVVVLRALLARAVALDVETHALHAELDEVI
jgi:hypothetical protein